jgi:arginine:ornithine antiporter/lysine permease
VYGCWLVYAAGLQYLLANCMFYIPGIFVYWKGRNERNEKLITAKYDYGVLGVVVVLGILCLILLLLGRIVLF